jgi:hypothetical protein
MANHIHSNAFSPLFSFFVFFPFTRSPSDFLVVLYNYFRSNARKCLAHPVLFNHIFPENRNCSWISAAAFSFSIWISCRNLSKYAIMDSSTSGFVFSIPAGTILNNRCNDPVWPNRWQWIPSIHASSIPPGAIAPGFPPRCRWLFHSCSFWQCFWIWCILRRMYPYIAHCLPSLQISNSEMANIMLLEN